MGSTRAEEVGPRRAGDDEPNNRLPKLISDRCLGFRTAGGGRWSQALGPAAQGLETGGRRSEPPPSHRNGRTAYRRRPRFAISSPRPTSRRKLRQQGAGTVLRRPRPMTIRDLFPPDLTFARRAALWSVKWRYLVVQRFQVPSAVVDRSERARIDQFRLDAGQASSFGMQGLSKGLRGMTA